jgi:hypothetical protein
MADDNRQESTKEITAAAADTMPWAPSESIAGAVAAMLGEGIGKIIDPFADTLLDTMSMLDNTFYESSIAVAGVSQIVGDNVVRVAARLDMREQQGRPSGGIAGAVALDIPCDGLPEVIDEGCQLPLVKMCVTCMAKMSVGRFTERNANCKVCKRGWNTFYRFAEKTGQRDVYNEGKRREPGLMRSACAEFARRNAYALEKIPNFSIGAFLKNEGKKMREFGVENPSKRHDPSTIIQVPDGATADLGSSSSSSSSYRSSRYPSRNEIVAIEEEEQVRKKPKRDSD